MYLNLDEDVTSTELGNRHLDDAPVLRLLVPIRMDRVSLGTYKTPACARGIAAVERRPGNKKAQSWAGEESS